MAVVIAFLANIAVAIAKTVAAFLTGSASLAALTLALPDEPSLDLGVRDSGNLSRPRRRRRSES